MDTTSNDKGTASMSSNTVSVSVASAASTPATHTPANANANEHTVSDSHSKHQKNNNEVKSKSEIKSGETAPAATAPLESAPSSVDTPASVITFHIDDDASGASSQSAAHIQPNKQQANGQKKKEQTGCNNNADKENLTVKPSSIESVPSSSSSLLLRFTIDNVTSSTQAESDEPLLANVAGYVRRGGMTALIGAASSGKSLLLQLLCGRNTATVNASGSMILEDRSYPLGHTPIGKIGFVPSDDGHLIGELTVRETFTIAAKLRRNDPDDVINRDVQSLLEGLGLAHRAENVIGTVLKRGLSGGEKRRTSVGCELAAKATVVCLDEPTSGLDAASAFIVMRSIQSIVRSSGGNMCVLASIQQPNSRLLRLFDDVMILGRGSAVYCGPSSAIVPYCAEIGFTVPPNDTPTDFVLHIVDQRFPKSIEATEIKAASFNFVKAYAQSSIGQAVHALLKGTDTLAVASSASPSGGIVRFQTSFFRQFSVLSGRLFKQAYRDLTLYILQFVLACAFGFMVGVEFWQLPREIGHRENDVANGIVWIVFIPSYLQVFKTYFIMTQRKRFNLEHANGSYSVWAFSLSDLFVTIVCSIFTFLPGVLIGYVMMNLPIETLGYALLVLFFAALTAESLISLLCQLPTTIPAAILLNQGALVILCVFAGGAFIDESLVGRQWKWLEKCSLFNWATKSITTSVFRVINYDCPLDFQMTDLTTTPATYSCFYNGQSFPTDSSWVITGQNVLQVSKGFTDRNEWNALGYLVLIMAVCRILTRILLRFPVDVLKVKIRSAFRKNQIHPTTKSQAAVELAAVADIASPPAPPKADYASIPLQTATSFSHASKCSLHWEGLNLRLRSTDALLVDNLTGVAKPGRILAVMGPSGASKTTLLNALSGRAPYARVTGKVTLGANQPLSRDHLDFVPQFDALNLSHTVADTLCLRAQLQTTLSADGEGGCKPRVVELLSILGLSSKAQTPVGELGAGERKRVNIALSLISDPNVMFLDEPTTGLDSETALVVVSYLRAVTRSTRVVCVLTIHQPSAAIFAQLDDLLLLSAGKMAYQGPAADARAYFESNGFPLPPNTTEPDFFLDLMQAKSRSEVYLEDGQMPAGTTPSEGDETTEDSAMVDRSTSASSNLPSWRALFDSSPLGLNPVGHYMGQPELPSCPSEWTRLRLLTHARLVYNYKEAGLYLLRIVRMIVLALFTGTLFLQIPLSLLRLNEIGGAMFFSCWVTLFAAISATPIFVRDQLIFEDEYLNGAFGLTIHVASLFLASVPYHMVTAICFQTIVWFLVSFHGLTFEPYVFATLLTFALLIMMEGISLLVVHALKDAMLATSASMVTLGMLFLFNGFFIRVEDAVASIAWVSWIMPTKYAVDSSLVNILSGQNYDDGQGDMIDGYTIGREFFKLANRTKWGDWAIVMSFALAFRCMHLLVLKFRYRHVENMDMAEQEQPAVTKPQHK